MDTQSRLERSQAYFNSINLWFYDRVVAFVSPFAWRCSMKFLQQRYARFLSDNHLEVGPGTGLLLARAQFQQSKPRVALMDYSYDCLTLSSRRLQQYRPTCYRQNILLPITEPMEKFDSIALNYVMHCVPGDFKSKSVAFAHLAPLLNSGGVIFGCTVLGQSGKPNLLARMAMRFLQRSGIFNNQADKLQDLQHALSQHFEQVEVELRGPTAVFSARKA